MGKQLLTLFFIGVSLVILPACGQPAGRPAAIAVEFNNHAACAYVAHDKGWFEEEGMELMPLFQIYESGAAIAAALARGDIQIGYLGLTAAITSYARGVPIKIVSGVHKYGYGLVARPALKDVKDLEGMTIGSLREGTVTDYLVNVMVGRFQLDNITILRMSPSEEVIALIGGRVDAAFIPEQHATTAESKGFPMLITSQDLWPGMQGDVLVVRTELIRDNPDLVKRLVAVTQRATAWVNDHPEETAKIMAEQLQAAGEKVFPLKEAQSAVSLEATPELISRSMARIEYSTDISPAIVQEMIDFMVELGYINEGMKAADILDLGYFQNQ
jgi:NitT/TauT family transport system substrate-binding protein